MNCLEFRRVIGAQPRIETAEASEHAAGCAACSRYRQEMQQMDVLIHRALSATPQKAATAPSIRERLTAWRTRRMTMAAGVVFAITAGALLWLAQPAPSLAQQLIDHVEHEPQAFADASPVARDDVDAVLKRSGLRLRPGVLNVSYAHSCWFRGRFTPHLVVQTAQGPVTVLILRQEESVAHMQRFNESGYSGEIAPAPQGVLAVLAEGGRAALAAQAVLNALEYEQISG